MPKMGTGTNYAARGHPWPEERRGTEWIKLFLGDSGSPRPIRAQIPSHAHQITTFLWLGVLEKHSVLPSKNNIGLARPQKKAGNTLSDSLQWPRRFISGWFWNDMTTQTFPERWKAAATQGPGELTHSSHPSWQRVRELSGWKAHAKGEKSQRNKY